MKRLIILFVVLVLIFAGFSYIGDRFNLNLNPEPEEEVEEDRIRIQSEESVVIDTVEKVGPSVVTISRDLPLQANAYDLGPFSIFGFDAPDQSSDPEPQSIGSGFIVSKDGLIVTNKHVVSDLSAKYEVVTNNDKRYEVTQIYRDPLNDISILKIDPSKNPGQSLKPVVLGNSSNLKVGQFVIAIGTALGEFPNTVTTGVISGLGRGITTGDYFDAEELDNVIQTDAAINPGNSGGPLLNSSSQVIGVNTAVASGGQNIGFALPIDTIKASLNNFNKTGQFNRAFLGVSYRVIDEELAKQNEVVTGAYIQTVISNSPAEKAGLIQGDIITKIDGKILSDEFQISNAVSKKKVGDEMALEVWKDGQTRSVTATLELTPSQ